MLSIVQLKSLCAQMNIRPHRRKGQHFLLDSRIPRMMADAANLSKEDTVLEIGPGFGVLTQALLEKAGKVVAVENDRRLVGYLKEKFAGEIREGRLELVEGDILRFQISDLRFKILKVVANIPYAITSEIVTRFVPLLPEEGLGEVGVTPSPPHLPSGRGGRVARIVLMIQKEVAERIVAKPPRMSRLAVFVQFHAEVEYLATVPRAMFWPEPEVDSAIVLITPHPNPLPQGERETKYPLALPRRDLPATPALAWQAGRARVRVEWEEVEPLVAAGFAHPRKQLYGQIAHLFCASMGAGTAENNKLSGLPRPGEAAKKILASCGVSPTARPGELSIEQWKCLATRESATSG